MTGFETRVGAYGVIVEEGSILLAHFSAYGESSWTLPGGGLELGESPETAAIREIREETGYDAVLESLLAVDSLQVPAARRFDRRPLHLHSLCILYRARVVGGSLRAEIGGSTDDVRWVPLHAVSTLSRVDIVEVALDHVLGRSRVAP